MLVEGDDLAESKIRLTAFVIISILDGLFELSKTSSNLSSNRSVWVITRYLGFW